MHSQRPALEHLEDRTLPSVTIASTNNNGNGYTALDFNQSGGYTPPDTNGAAGPTNYVETVNQEIALYNPKATGASATTSSLSNFWFTTGGLAHADSGSSLSDPVVEYNDQIGRFVVVDQDINFNTHVSNVDVAVSKSSSPATLSASDWSFYAVKTTESGYDADYPGNFGYNHDATVVTLNMFSTTGGAGHCQIVSLNNTDLQNNVAQANLHVYNNDLSDFSDRPTAMHDSVAGDPMWLVTEHGDNASIDVIKMANVLSNAPTFTYTNLAVTPYSNANSPLNPNGTTITTKTDGRIQKAAEWNNTLVATHAVGVGTTEDDVQWYKINVTGGTPALADQGRISGGNNTYSVYPSIDINSSGLIGMTYIRSGNDTSTDYMSMYVTGRNSSDAAGTMETPVLVPAGKGVANYTDFGNPHREGDLSGINVDPSNGSFWAANEYANTEATANWGTAIANFTISNPLPSTDMAVAATGPSSVTAGTNVTYTITLTNNGPASASGVVLTDNLPAGSSFVSLTQTGGTDGFTLNQSGSSVTETASGSIASGSSDTFTLVVSAPAGLANGAAFNDTASVSASNPDSNTANNSATVNGTVVNNNPNADLALTASGPSTANEGDTVTYTLTVTNNGPAAASGVSLTDTLPSILSYKSATSSQGTFSQSGGVVTFSIGSMNSGASVTATVVAQATEDGSTSDTASVSATSPDPTSSNNSASVSTNFAEPAISVSGSKTTKSSTLTNYTAATFTHANAVEPVSAFSATINWGDGTTSAGTITLSGTTYSVTGSHTYGSGGRHTITTTVKEVGATPNDTSKLPLGDDGGHGKSTPWKFQDLVHQPGNGGGNGSGSATESNSGATGTAAPSSQATLTQSTPTSSRVVTASVPQTTSGGHTGVQSGNFVVSVAPSGDRGTTTDVTAMATTTVSNPHSSVTDLLFSLGATGFGLPMGGATHYGSWSDWSVE